MRYLNPVVIEPHYPASLKPWLWYLFNQGEGYQTLSWWLYVSKGQLDSNGENYTWAAQGIYSSSQYIHDQKDFFVSQAYTLKLNFSSMEPFQQSAQYLNCIRDTRYLLSG